MSERQGAATTIRPDARDKATGTTNYSADMPVPAGTLEAVLVRSPLPHAEITGIATAAAALADVDYRELPSVTEPVTALGADSSLARDAPWEYPGAVITEADGPSLQSVVTGGESAAVARALTAATVVSATYRAPAGRQGYLEPQAWVAFLRRTGQPGCGAPPNPRTGCAARSPPAATRTARLHR